MALYEVKKCDKDRVVVEIQGGDRIARRRMNKEEGGGVEVESVVEVECPNCGTHTIHNNQVVIGDGEAVFVVNNMTGKNVQVYRSTNPTKGDD